MGEILVVFSHGGLSWLQPADEYAVSWLTRYSSWHAYEKYVNDELIVGQWWIHVLLSFSCWITCVSIVYCCCCQDENKEIALGTSKLNYLDPRITVAWYVRLSVCLHMSDVCLSVVHYLLHCVIKSVCLSFSPLVCERSTAEIISWFNSNLFLWLGLPVGTSDSGGDLVADPLPSLLWNRGFEEIY